MKYLTILSVVLASVSALDIAAFEIPANVCDVFEAKLKEDCVKGIDLLKKGQDEMLKCVNKVDASDINGLTKCGEAYFKQLFDHPEVKKSIECYTNCGTDTGCIAKCSNGLFTKEVLDQGIGCANKCKDDLNCLTECVLKKEGGSTPIPSKPKCKSKKY